MPDIELLADYECVCGENPLWHTAEQRVYWTDIETGRLFRYEPATCGHEQFYSGDIVGGFTFQADGALLLFMAKGAVKVWRDGKLTTVIDEIPAERQSRFNDVIADHEGRVFCGTMPSPAGPGRLYRLDRDGSIQVVLEGIRCSNGMGFTPDGKSMYYTDSGLNKIYLYDYDRAAGTFSNQRLFAQTTTNEGTPDGMTVDAEGYVWSARWGGNCAVRYTPDGREVERVMFPAVKVSSVVFGGPDYTDLYVTTAGGNAKETDGKGAGALYRYRPATPGVAEFPSRIGL
jgi:D-xylono/L-arabinono-1,4-lactonase